MNRKVVFISVAVIFVIAISFFGFRYYKITTTLGTITPLLQNVSLRVSNDARYEYEPSKITYKELFEKIEKDLSEIDNKIIDIQSLPTTFCEDKVSAAVTYAQSCQELLRALLNKNRKMLALQSALEWSKKTLDLYLGAGYYGAEYAKKTFNEASDDVKTKIQELKDSTQEVSAVIKKLEETRKKAIEIFPGKAIIDTSVLEKLNKKIDEESKPEEK
jgi:predicted CopG family antitoxin